jgi:transcriptional regulator with XRE-family HTH domain
MCSIHERMADDDINDNINRASIGVRVREARGDLSQADMARELGISQASLSRVEAGEQHLSAVALARLSALTGCDPTWLLTGEVGR